MPVVVLEPNELQEKALEKIRNGVDCNLIGGTSCGKSTAILLYGVELHTAGDERIIAVVAPLRTLIHELMAKAESMGLRCVHLAAGVKFSSVHWASFSGLVFFTVEKFAMDGKTKRGICRLMEKGRIAAFAIDEIHFLNTAGRGFRPHYRVLRILKEFNKKVPILGTTATLSTRAALDVSSCLRMGSTQVRSPSLDRSDLTFEVRLKPRTRVQCLEQVLELSKKGKVIAFSRSICQTWNYAKTLKKMLKELKRNDEVKVAVYFSPGDNVCRAYLRLFQNDSRYKILLCTSAVGVGLDFLDVTSVVQLSMPWAIEDKQQQDGRAARHSTDGGHCVLFFSMRDVGDMFRRFKDIDDYRLWTMVRFCVTNECKRKLVLAYFGEDVSEHRCPDCPSEDAPKQPKFTVAQVQRVCSKLLENKKKVTVCGFSKLICKVLGCIQNDSYNLMWMLFLKNILKVEPNCNVWFDSGYTQLNA